MDNACNRPQDTVFRDEVTFCCSDIGTRVMLVVKVQDIHGNMNFCMIEMDVQDKNTVALLCPSNITISCTLDYTDLILIPGSLIVANEELFTGNFLLSILQV